MKKILTLCLVIFTLSSFSVTAAPSKAAADKWYSDFRKAKDKALDALAINKKEQYRSVHAEIEALQKRAVKLFGEPMSSDLARCTSSASYLGDVWSEITSIGGTGNVGKMTPSLIAQFAWSGGDDQAICRAELEKLK